MSFSRWVSDKNIETEDLSLKVQSDFMKSVLYNPSNSHRYYFSCFKNCTNQADGFKLNNECLKECENKIQDFYSYFEFNSDTLRKGQRGKVNN